MQVFVRMRPVNTRDKAPSDQLCVQKVPPNSLRFLGDGQSTSGPTYSRERHFTFDGVMGWRATQEEVLKGVGHDKSSHCYSSSFRFQWFTGPPM